IGIALVVPVAPSSARQMDPDRKVPGGGIMAAGWRGRIDPTSAAGESINDSKFAMANNEYVLTIGPAAVYWNPANTAKGDYSVSPTFKEPSYMSANSHDHPYGVFIAGNKLDTDQANLLYCSAYGDGRFIFRGFGPASFQLNGRRGAPNEAVHKAAGKGEA